MELPYVKIPNSANISCHVCGRSNSDCLVHPATPIYPAGVWTPEPTFAKPICGSCFRSQAEETGKRLHEVEPNIPKWVDDQLERIGMATSERKADISQVPKSLLDAVPDVTLKYMLAGVIPKSGVGLAGLAGSGKTSLLAVLVHGLLLQHSYALAPFQELKGIRQIVWMNWPITCDRWRVNGIDAGIEKEIVKAQRAKLLILDDLGRETRRRAASEDAATGHLDAIITERDREQRVTLWSTNLTEQELYERYGTGMIRRLLRKNPIQWLSNSDFHPNAM